MKREMYQDVATTLGVWKNPWTGWWEFRIPGGAVGGYNSFEECCEAAMDYAVESEARWSQVTYE